MLTGICYAALLASGTVLASPHVAVAEEAPAPVVQFGPIRFGMSVAQIRSAVPDAHWEVTSKSPFTGRPFGLVAKRALDYGGWRMNIGVRDEKYDRHVELSSRMTVPDAAACEKAGIGLFTALEDSAGPLVANDDPLGESFAFGSGSTALFNGYDARSKRLRRSRVAGGRIDRFGMVTRRDAERLAVRGQVGFDARSAENCSAEVIAIGWRERPPFEVMPYDENKVVGRMSIGDRHRLASTLNFSSDAVVVKRQCEVSRQSGKVLTCQAADGAVDPAFANVSGRYAGGMTFDMSGLDRDDPQTVLVEIPVRIARSDVRPFVPPASLLPLSQVEFATTPSPRDFRDAFPWDALRAGVGADVSVGCRIQDDGSLVCATLGVRPQEGGDPFRAGFERAAERLVPLYRAAPRLKDGTPSADAAFAMGVQFKVGN
jgi:hypothetical protein